MTEPDRRGAVRHGSSPPAWRRGPARPVPFPVGRRGRSGGVIGPSFPAVLAAAQRGDEQSFAVLWCDLQPAVLRYLRVVAPAAAEDLAADTWVSVARRLPGFVGDERGFRVWMFTVARHRAVDRHQRPARQPTRPVALEVTGGRATPDDPAAGVLDALSTRAALALIAELPQSQAEVVALRVLSGLDVAEVAQITGKDPTAVRVLTHRGLRRLARRLESTRLPGRWVTSER